MKGSSNHRIRHGNRQNLWSVCYETGLYLSSLCPSLISVGDAAWTTNHYERSWKTLAFFRTNLIPRLSFFGALHSTRRGSYNPNNLYFFGITTGGNQNTVILIDSYAKQNRSCPSFVCVVPPMSNGSVMPFRNSVGTMVGQQLFTNAPISDNVSHLRTGNAVTAFAVPTGN